MFASLKKLILSQKVDCFETDFRFCFRFSTATWRGDVRPSWAAEGVQALTLKLPALHHQRLGRRRESERRWQTPDFCEQRFCERRFVCLIFVVGANLRVVGTVGAHVEVQDIGRRVANLKKKEIMKIKIMFFTLFLLKNNLRKLIIIGNTYQ